MIAAEQKARAVYDNILRLSDDADVNEVIKFLRQREIVHFQRFGEAKLTNSNRFSINIKGAEGQTSAPQFYFKMLFLLGFQYQIFSKTYFPNKNIPIFFF